MRLILYFCSVPVTNLSALPLILHHRIYYSFILGLRVKQCKCSHSVPGPWSHCSISLVISNDWIEICLKSWNQKIFQSLLKYILEEGILGYAFWNFVCLKLYSFVCWLGKQTHVQNRYNLKTLLYCFPESSVSYKISNINSLIVCFYLFRRI